MLVKCPNCSFEQPLDTYCASCGKPLAQLIQKEKKRQNDRDTKTKLIISFSALVFLGCLIAFYNITKNLNINLSSSSSPTEPSVEAKKVFLKNTKIRSSDSTGVSKTPPQEQQITSSIKTNSALLKEVPAKESSANPSPEKAKSIEPKLESLYIVDVAKCILSDLSTPIKQAGFNYLLNCSHVLALLENNFDSQIIDEGSTFVLKLTALQTSKKIDLFFNLATHNFTYDFHKSFNVQTLSQSLYLLKKMEPSVVDDIGEPAEEMMESKVLSKLVKLGAPPPKTEDIFLLMQFAAP